MFRDAKSRPFKSGVANTIAQVKKQKARHDAAVARAGSKTTDDYRDMYVEAFLDAHQQNTTHTKNDSNGREESPRSELSAKGTGPSFALELQSRLLELRQKPPAQVVEGFGSWRTAPTAISKCERYLDTAKYNIVHKGLLPLAAVPHPYALEKTCVNGLNRKLWVQWREDVKVAGNMRSRRRDPGQRRSPNASVGWGLMTRDAALHLLPTFRRILSDAEVPPPVAGAKTGGDYLAAAHAACLMLHDVVRRGLWDVALHIYYAEEVGKQQCLPPKGRDQMSVVIIASLLESIRRYQPWFGSPPVTVLVSILRHIAAAADTSIPPGGRRPLGGGAEATRPVVPPFILPMWISLLRRATVRRGDTCNGNTLDSRGRRRLSWDGAMRLMVAELMPAGSRSSLSASWYMTPMAWEALLDTVSALGAPLGEVQAIVDELVADDVVADTTGGSLTKPKQPTDVVKSGVMGFHVPNGAQLLRHVRLWNAYLRACAVPPATGAPPEWLHALEVFGTNMPQYGVLPNTDTFCALAHVLVSAGRWEHALRALQAVKRHEGRLIPRTEATYVCLFGALRAGRQWESALRYLCGETIKSDFSFHPMPRWSHRREEEKAAGVGVPLATHVHSVCSALHHEYHVPPSVLVAARWAALLVSDDDAQQHRDGGGNKRSPGALTSPKPHEKEEEQLDDGALVDALFE